MITALVISVLIKTFLVQAFYIPSGSMENTLLVNDRVLVNKLADKSDEIHRGDVVVFHDPGGWLHGPEVAERDGVLGALRDGLVFVGLAPAVGEEDLIKRVIGVGGDTVACCDDKARHRQRRPARRALPLPRRRALAGEVLGEGPRGPAVGHGRPPVGLRGQPGPQSQPGAGFVPVDDVIGRAFTIVWPLDRGQAAPRARHVRPARTGRVPALIRARPS